MHYSTIELELKEHALTVDRGSTKTKRKFAFLLEEGDILLENKKLFDVHGEVEVLSDYTFNDKSKRPKETINIYKIIKIIKK